MKQHKRHKRRLVAGLLLAAAVLVPGFAFAANQNITLAKGQTHHGTYYAFGQTLIVDGDVDGDVICGAQTVIINGAVTGDVICGGQSVTVNGPVTGSIRAAGQDVSINKTVGRNVTVAGATIVLGSGGRVEGEVAVAGQAITISGPVAHGAFVQAETLTLDAPIGGDVTAMINELSFGSGGKVAGNFTYTNKDTLTIDAGKVSGTIAHKLPESPAEPSPRDQLLSWLSGLIYAILTGLVVALILIWIAPRAVRHTTSLMQRRPGASIGWGALAFFAAPAVLIALLMSVIGIPLGILIACTWFVTLVAGTIFGAIAFGGWLLGRTGWQRESLVWAAVVGLPVLGLAVNIPILGVLAAAAIVFWGLGGVMLSLYDQRHHRTAKS